jgi:hypothetical protein
MGLRIFDRFPHTKSRFLKFFPTTVPDSANNVLRGRPRVYNGGGSSRVVLLQIETVLPLAVRKDHLVPLGGLDSGLTSRGGSISPRGPAVAPLHPQPLGAWKPPPAELRLKRRGVPYKLALLRGGGRLCQLWSARPPRVHCSSLWGTEAPLALR